MANDEKLIGIGKVTSCNRIPVTAILDLLNAKRGDHLKFIEMDNGDITISKV